MGRRRLIEIALGAVLVLSACQAPLARNASPSPVATPAVPRELAAADQKMFNGDYEGAETAYQSLVATGTAGAASHYAILLTYEGRFSEAVDQAAKGVGARRDSASLARLCRALDWSESIPPALQACTQALAARPLDPIAHIYYAETLTDSGRYEEAVAELNVADTFVYDSYSRAELAREWANYYRQRSSPGEAQNNLQIALKTQPRFPERTLELARNQYLGGKPDTGRSLVEKLRQAQPQSARVLLAAGDTAFIGLDADEAASLYAAAAQAHPDSPETALAQAELAVAAKHDFKAAHDSLLASLKKDPSQAGIYEYLRYLDLLVLKTNPDDDLKPIAPTPPAALGETRKRALTAVNATRTSAGLPALTEDAAMAEAAVAHAYYFLFNFGQPQLRGSGVHGEDQNLTGYVAGNGLLRARHFGYTGTRGAEVIDNVFTPEAAVRIWVDSVFHRFPVTDPEATVAGFGQAQVGLISIAILEIGLGPPARGGAVVYPTDGGRDVPAAFTGNEVPDPLPQGVRPPTGYPVTLQTGGDSTLAVSSGRLIGPDGNDVPGLSLNPGHELGPNQWAFLTSSPLKPGSRYTADVSGQLDGQAFAKRWSFTVVAPR